MIFVVIKGQQSKNLLVKKFCFFSKFSSKIVEEQKLKIKGILILILHLIFNSSRLFFKSLATFLEAPTAIGMTVIFMFQRCFFCSQARSK